MSDQRAIDCIMFDPASDNIDRIIFRTIIHDDNLHIGVGLAANTLKALDNKTCMVVTDCYDRNKWLRSHLLQ